MTTGVLVLFAAVVAGLVAIAWWNRAQAKSPPDLRSAADQMAALANQAVETAGDVYETRLDYSASSVELVEKILARLHDEHRERPFFPERLAGEANRWGAYVGEVARRIKGGQWQRDSVHAGAGTHPLVWGAEDEVYPLAWCFRRIANGLEDNIWDKFRVAVLERAERAVEHQP